MPQHSTLQMASFHGAIHQNVDLFGSDFQATTSVEGEPAAKRVATSAAFASNGNGDASSSSSKANALHEVVDAIALKSPETQAAVCSTFVITYRELVAQSQQLAGALLMFLLPECHQQWWQSSMTPRCRRWASFAQAFQRLQRQGRRRRRR